MERGYRPPLFDPNRFFNAAAAPDGINPVIRAMADADANASYEDLRDTKRVRVSRSFAWLNWEFGIGFGHDPHDLDEPWGLWINLGPLTLYVDFKRKL